VDTSGDYQRQFEFNGRRYGHIIDLRTGRPADTDCRAVSVIAPTCAQAGWLATTVCVLGSTAGLDLVESQHDCAAAVVTDAEKLCTTPLSGVHCPVNRWHQATASNVPLELELSVLVPEPELVELVVLLVEAPDVW